MCGWPWTMAVVGGQQKAAGAAGRVADRLPRLGGDDVDDRLDQRPRGEVLAGAALGVLGVLLQQPLVGVPLHIGAHHRPVFLVDEIDDQAAQLGRVLELVLRLVEDQPEQALLVAEIFQGMAVVVEKLVAVLLHQRRPGVGGRDGARLVIGRLGALVGHLEEEEIGELFDVVAVAHAVVAQDVAEVPEFADNCGGGHDV